TNHLEAASFESLSVKALCERVQISEATFFNYFPKKEDLIVYLDRLWTLELNWYGRQATEQKRGLAVIETLFRYTSIQIQKKPGLMGEIIAHEARARERHAGPEITPAERMIAFSDLDDINSLPDDSLENLLRSSLQAGIDQGELPPNTAIAAAMVALVSIFYGVPLAMQHANPAAIGAMYRQQLALLWAGLRAVAQK
ncbi:MAG: TetR/AcrR family transcriptional regulator, partial [Gammaproteobacteria bacterium]|nr:TetR/AcrR family transcriptional regulator [Gammaproteobacteria bacterium]